MEFERSLFRIHERVMQSENLEHYSKIYSRVCFAIAGLNLFFLVILHLSFINSYETFAESYSRQVLSNESEYQSSDFNLTIPGDKGIYTGNRTILPEDIYNITLDYTDYEFSFTYHSLLLPDQVLARKEFTFHKIEIDTDEIMPGLLYPIVVLNGEQDTVVINAIASTFKERGGMLRNKETKELWHWVDNEFEYYQKNHYNIFDICLRVLKAVFVVFIVSSITALICRLAIAGSAALIIACVTCCRRFGLNEESRFIFYYSYPWIGQPAWSLQSTGRSTWPLIISYLSMLFVFYFMYTCCYLVWTSIIFGHLLPEGIDNSFYTFISFMEFYSLLFVRSKKSVLYFSRISYALIIMFLLYRFNHFYPFVWIAFKVVFFTCFGLMGYGLYKWEKPAYVENAGNPDHFRSVYHPVFSRNQQTTGLPEIWTLFYPVESRDAFSTQEMTSLFPGAALEDQSATV